jgi:NAD(P)-dependent dehydrogenase (short-subunit alcohol dehydrogenase family)
MDRVQDPGAFYAAQQVLPTLVEAGHGTIVLTGASASLRGKARFSPLAVGKFGLRALAQSMAPEREENTMLSPDAIAETYWRLHTQDPTAWTLELDLRPSMESI